MRLALGHQARYARHVERTLLQRLHNPRNSTCGCDPECWCRRTTIGRAVKWWFPARWFGIRHKNSWYDKTFAGWSDDDIRAWKRAQAREAKKRISSMARHQPKYESIVRLGPMRFGMTVRLQDGTVVVHEIRGGARLEPGS
jgi:hypothetical protein